VTSLVLCVDRTDDVGRHTDRTTPVVGWEAVESLVTEVGLSDPEDSSVNSILEALAVARDLERDGDEAVVAVVSGSSDSVISADRTVANQIDDLVDTYAPESAVVVIDSAQDERLVPIVESRVRVDSVDRVVVRQARDLESTYYLLKQFLADEELRQTVLVPIGITLVVFPVLSFVAGTAVALAAITAVIGVFLLYKGFGVDDYLIDIATQARDAVYSGQVSIVTYAVAGGLTLIGLFAGAFGVSELPSTGGYLLPIMAFAHDAVPWLSMAALAASLGRLLDEAIQDDHLSSPYLNLPFIAVAMGLVVRGFTAYFLELGGAIEPLGLPPIEVSALAFEGAVLSPGERLAVFVAGALVVAFVGVQIASFLSGTAIEDGDGEAEGDLPDSERS
jgi:putative membrane protein